MFVIRACLEVAICKQCFVHVVDEIIKEFVGSAMITETSLNQLSMPDLVLTASTERTDRALGSDNPRCRSNCFRVKERNRDERILSNATDLSILEADGLRLIALISISEGSLIRA